MTALLPPFDFLPFLLRLAGASAVGGRECFLLGSAVGTSGASGTALGVTQAEGQYDVCVTVLGAQSSECLEQPMQQRPRYPRTCSQL